MVTAARTDCSGLRITQPYTAQESGRESGPRAMVQCDTKRGDSQHLPVEVVDNGHFAGRALAKAAGV
jgi:hypothetical protein